MQQRNIYLKWYGWETSSFENYIFAHYEYTLCEIKVNEV